MPPFAGTGITTEGNAYVGIVKLVSRWMCSFVYFELSTLWFVPVQNLRDYFGEKTALYFAFIGDYMHWQVDRGRTQAHWFTAPPQRHYDIQAAAAALGPKNPLLVKFVLTHPLLNNPTAAGQPRAAGHRCDAQHVVGEL